MGVTAFFHRIDELDREFTMRVHAFLEREPDEVFMVIKPIVGLLSNGVWKSILAFIGTFFIIDVRQIGLLMFLLLADFGTGVWASLRRGENISSKRIRESIIKAAEYLFFIFVISAIASVYPELNWMARYAFIATALTEMWSISENLDSMLVKKLSDALRSAIASKTEFKTPDDSK